MFLAALVAVALVHSSARGPTMKAIVVHQFGGPDVLKYEDAPRPQPKQGEILVRVVAAGVNPVDTYVTAGKFGNAALPLIPGRDVAGTVEELGPGVTKFKKGDAVYAYSRNGGFAEYAAVGEKDAAPKPASLTFVEAAGVPVGGGTAWRALVDTAHVAPGQTVLVQGGSGGVGDLLATASTANQDLLKELGADVAIDYTKQKIEDVAKNVDVVLETVRGEIDRDYPLVKKGGYLVSIVGPADRAKAEQFGIQAPELADAGSPLPELTKLFDAKKLKVVVSETLPLSEASKALQQVGTHHTRGKIVLKVADEE
jgi:NADPH:quinone reductase-like Zn-dependent oxidoreductase